MSIISFNCLGSVTLSLAEGIMHDVFVSSIVNGGKGRNQIYKRMVIINFLRNFVRLYLMYIFQTVLNLINLYN